MIFNEERYEKAMAGVNKQEAKSFERLILSANDPSWLAKK